MTIKEVLEIVGKEKIIKWTIDIPSFYLQSSRTFRKYFEEDQIAKLIRLIYYSFLSILLHLIFTNSEFVSSARFLLTNIIFLFFTTVVLCLTNFFIGLIFKHKMKIIDIIYFIILVKFLSLPFQFIFYSLFISTEKYEYYFVLNSVIAFYTLYIVFYSTKIFYKRNLAIILGSIFNVTLLNLGISLFCFLNFDHQSVQLDTFSDDLIDREYTTVIKSNLDTLLLRTPTHRAVVTSDSGSFSIYIFDDQNSEEISNNLLAVYSKDKIFRNSILSQVHLFDSLAQTIVFQKNKIIIDSLRNYLKTVKTDMQKAIDTSNNYVLERTDIITKNGGSHWNIKLLVLDTDMLWAEISYFKTATEYIKTQIVGNYPNYILNFLLLPADKFCDN